MKKKIKINEYLAPRVKMVEIKARRAVCGSPYDAHSSDSDSEELNF